MKREFKNKILFLLLTVAFMLPFAVHAATFSPALSCPSTAAPGDTITCKMTATIDSTITGIQGSIAISGLDYEFTKSNITCYSCDKDGFAYGEVNGISAAVGSTSVSLGTLKVTMPSNVTGSQQFVIRVTNVVAASNESDNSIEKPDLSQTVTVKVKSTDSSLKSLEVEGMTLGPTFSPSVFEYSLMETDKASIVVKATPNNGAAKVTQGAGTQALKYGSNTITVKVQAEAGNVSNYTIKVTRTDTRDTTNTLKSLSVKDYKISPEFKPETTTYSLTVEPNVTKISVEGEVTSSKSTFDGKYKPGDYPLKYGKNAILIKVKAENEKVRTYTINVTRTDDRDSNNYLSSITLSEGNIKFDKNTTSYTINVASTVKEITISAIAESSKAKVTGSGTKTLKDGSNTFEISVKAENESVKKYKIIVNKGTSGGTTPVDTNATNETTPEPLPTENALKSIIIKNHDISFDPNILNYNITLGEGETKLDILYQVAEGYTATVEGNENLKNGSVVKLLVEKDGQTVEYTFKVKVEEKAVGGNNLILYVALGFLGVVVFGLLLAIFTKKKPTPEEVVKEKFVDEGPRSFHNERLITEGVDGSQVTGSMISQVETPNSMSDMAPTPAPMPEPTPVVEPTPVMEPTPVSAPQSEITMAPAVPEMEPMPINGPVTQEVAGDFTPSPEVNFQPIGMTSSTQSFQMSEPTGLNDIQ